MLCRGNKQIFKIKKMKIAILYICTGPYSKLFSDFYETANEHLLSGKALLTYFVWTDTDEFNRWANVKVYPHKCMGFPLDSLFRFEMFLEAKDDLKNFDYIYFFNANAKFIEDVGYEILPDDSGLACRIWKNPVNNPMFYCIEKDKHSTAYVPPYDGPYLNYSGGINAGTYAAFLKMTEELAKNIRTDWNNGIIAKAHDQSHLNHYFHYHKCKIITHDYCMPGEMVTDNDHPKIIFRPKKDRDFNKKTQKNQWQHIKSRAKYLLEGISWYLKISVRSGEEKYIR